MSIQNTLNAGLTGAAIMFAASGLGQNIQLGNQAKAQGEKAESLASSGHYAASGNAYQALAETQQKILDIANPGDAPKAASELEETMIKQGLIQNPEYEEELSKMFGNERVGKISNKLQEDKIARQEAENMLEARMRQYQTQRGALEQLSELIKGGGKNAGKT